jgi:autophagy-related protein 5
MKPWKISVHFHSFPNDKLLRCTTIESSERYFDHSLKQALYLLHGTSSSFYGMSVEDKQQIWEGITRSNYDLFETIAIILKPILIATRLVPVRIIRHSKPTIQKPIQTTNSNDTDMLLSDVLEICLPQFNSTLYSVLIQGIEIPLSAPIFSVWSIFSHPDFFLYICLITHTE